MTDQRIAAFITFSITFTGILTNLIVVLAIQKTNSMNGSFGIITKNQAICNIIMCLIFLLFVFPVQLSASQLLINYSHYFGTAAMTVYEISNGSHFLIALNRFCALFSPHRYERIFRNSTTIILRNLLWICSISCCTYFYELLQCNFFYNPVTWTFEFSSTDFCSRLTWYSDFTFNTAATVITLIINLLAAYKERKNSKVLLDIAGIKKSVVQRKREWNFIKQTCFQGLSIFLGQFAYYVIAPVIGDSSTVALFVLATLWAFMLALEGAIILASNREIRIVFKRIFDAIYMGMYLFYYTPMMVFLSPLLVNYSYYAGFVLNITITLSIDIHVCSTLNRFLAVFTPFLYPEIFKNRLTKIYIFGISVQTTFVMVLFNFWFPCGLPYDTTKKMFFYDLTIPVCNYYAYYLAFLKNVFLLILEFFINIATLLKIQYIRKKTKKNESEKVNEKERNFVKQIFGQTTCYIIGYSTFLLNPYYDQFKFLGFFSSLLVWDIVGMFDGFFTVYYNSDIWNRIWRSRQKKTVNVNVVSP